MSILPLEMATEELERRTLGTKPRPSPWESFAGTVVSVLVSLSLLSWGFFLVHRIVETEPYCEALLYPDLLLWACFNMFFIFVVFMYQLQYAIMKRNRFATVGLVLVLCTGVIVVSGFPNLEGKTTIGLFHSPPSTEAVAHNNSVYWDRNVKTCMCKTEACEDLVYREYLVQLYDLYTNQEFDFSNYTKMDEVKRLGPPAQDLNGTSVKNGDRSGPNSDSQYHEVCYSESSGDKGNKRFCYNCYACEEKYLRDEQRSRWSYANKLFVMSLLLIVSNVILFLAESWARYKK